MTEDSYVLTISGGGSKGMYACGILKALEELDMKKNIKAIFGVSAGALTGAYRLSGWKAEDIYHKYVESGLFTIKNLSLFPLKGIMKAGTMEKIVKPDIKRRFEKLEKPLYVGATDLLKGKFVLYNSGELLRPVIGSLSVPGIFAPVEYDGALLIDGGVTNNFPIDMAKKLYPNMKQIGILLSKFKKNQKIENLVDTLQVTYDLLLKGHLSQTFNEADILFYRDLKTGMTENNIRKLQRLFELGYQDGLDAFNS